ncbi:MAG: site-2 protease family protein [Bryobacteraceae bacterium]
MKWSWKLMDVAGIGIYIHATFLLIVLWVAFGEWSRGGSMGAVLGATLFLLALFGCVVLHELGHALTARRYGIATRDITLLPIGGVARLERMPEDPRQELMVALAGPAVNVVIAGLLMAVLIAAGRTNPLDEVDLTNGSFVGRLMGINLGLAIFNLLPAFPMDGGRVLRALLATRMEYTRATRAAAIVGQGFAFLLGFVGLLGNPVLLFIALFVWMGAEQESNMVQVRSALGGIPLARAMITDFRTLAMGDTLQQAVDLILTGSQQDFPVVNGEAVAGVLTRADLLRALAERGPGAPVSEVMRRGVQVVESSEMLETAFRRLQGCDCRVIPVVSRGRLVGLVTPENMGEFLMIQSAMDRAGRLRI